MKQTTKLYKLKDTLETVEDASKWASGKFTCASCRKTEDAAKFLTPVGDLCVGCVEIEMKRAARTVDLLNWSLPQYKAALESADKLRDHLTALWRFHDILRVAALKYPNDVDDLRKLVIQSLGFLSEHPLAAVVRQAAYQACLSFDKTLAPMLIAESKTTPWQHYANTLMALSHIAPENHEVRAFIQKAAEDDNLDIRKRAQAILLKLGVPSKQAEAFAKPPSRQAMLENVMEMLPPELRELMQLGFVEETALDVPFIASDAQPAPKAISASAAPQRIMQLVEQHYSADALKRIYKTYLHGQFFSEDDFPQSGNWSINKLKKNETVHALASVFSQQEPFLRFFAKLTKEAQQMFQQFVWEGEEVEVKTLEAAYKVNIVKEREKRTAYGYGGGVGNAQDIEDPFVIFQIRTHYNWYAFDDRYAYYFSIADELRNVFKHYLPRPQGYDVLPIPALPQTEFQHEDRDQILRQIHLYDTYVRQGNLKYSESTGKLMKASLAQMTKYCGVREFYLHDKELAALKTTLMIDFFQKNPLKPDKEPEVYLKTLFSAFFQAPTPKGKKLHEFLYHLKGGYYDHDLERRDRRVRQALAELLKLLPPGQWVAFDNARKAAAYRNLDFEVVSRRDYGNDLFFTQRYKSQYGARDERVYVREREYKNAVVTPFLKTMCFLFSAFGLLDIAYDLPKNQDARDRDKPYLSAFDGLRFLRLTPLGAYILGLQETYQTAEAQETGAIILDDKRLILNVEGRDPLKTMVVEKLAEKISDTCYKVTYQSFLKECVTQQDITQKVKMFKEHVTAAPPRVWQEFLEDVAGKINPLAAAEKMAVFKLQPHKELIALLARDETLKKYILKAEDYHIIIAQKDVSKVKKRLEEFGYFIDNF